MEHTDTATIAPKKTNSGQFKQGNTLGGRTSTGYQSFKDRLVHWLETKTIDDIEKLVRSRTEWKKLSAIDGIVVRRIAGAIGKDGAADFVMVLDRLLGKPAQEITGAGGAPLITQYDVNELARRTAFLMSLPKPQDAVVIDQIPHKETEKPGG